MKVTLLLLVVLLAVLGYGFWPQQHDPESVLIVGARSGTLAQRDLSMISQLQNGLQSEADRAGVKLNVYIIDSQKPAATVKEEVAAILQSGVHRVMGCGDSACVRTLLPLLQQYDAVLIYPGSSEGLMNSNRLIHLGPVANQYLFPAVSWVRQNLGSQVMFVGSESARSHMLYRLLQDQLLVDNEMQLQDAEFVRNSDEFPSLLDKIAFYRPDVVLLDACEWLTDTTLMAALSRQGTRLFSLCTDQPPPAGISLYYISPYFDLEHNPENRRLRSAQGELTAGMVNVQWMIRLWAAGLRQGDLQEQHRWLSFLRGHNDLTAAGPVQIDQHMQGCWRSMYIAQQSADKPGQRLLWMSDTLLRPVMFPGLGAPSDWQHNLTIFWRNAGGAWRTASVNGEQL